jgi:hypothetical protein
MFKFPPFKQFINTVKLSLFDILEEESVDEMELAANKPLSGEDLHVLARRYISHQTI